MCPRPPHAFFAPALVAVLILGSGALDASRAQEGGRVAATDKGTAIPPLRAEPVVPASAAKSIATQLNDAYVSVFEHVAPVVVVIDVLKRSTPESDSEYFPDLFRAPPPNATKDKDKDKDKPGKDGKEKDPKAEEPPPPPAARRHLTPSEGSGFIIQPSGFILTNNHVVSDAEKITVRLKDGRQFQGRLVGADKKTDIAVVKIEASDLPTAELANSDTLRVGQIACAIGVPYNQDYSFTAGVVSAKDRNKLMQDDSFEDYIQTDASINPGNSGGPLVDLDGRVIGMNTLINGFNRGLGFAIPSNLLREVGDQLMRTGRVVRGYLGVRIRTLSTAKERVLPMFSGVEKGVLIDTIDPNSPAMNSKLRASDIVTEVDGVSVGTDWELQKQILTKKIGSTVQLTVVRKTKIYKIPVLTAERPAEPARITIGDGEVEPAEADETLTPLPSPAKREEVNPLYGLQLQDLTKDLATNLSLEVGATGVLVTSVLDGSVADRAKLEVKDVITSVDDRPIKDAASFKEAVKAGDPRRGIMCYVDRLGAKTFVVLKVD